MVMNNQPRKVSREAGDESTGMVPVETIEYELQDLTIPQRDTTLALDIFALLYSPVFLKLPQGLLQLFLHECWWRSRKRGAKNDGSVQALRERYARKVYENGGTQSSPTATAPQTYTTKNSQNANRQVGC